MQHQRDQKNTRMSATTNAGLGHWILQCRSLELRMPGRLKAAPISECLLCGDFFNSTCTNIPRPRSKNSAAPISKPLARIGELADSGRMASPGAPQPDLPCDGSP